MTGGFCEDTRGKTAIVLQYDKETTPTVTTKAKNDLADQIIELAREHDIYIHEDPELIELLSQLDIGWDIPPALYTAVAEVIAFAYILAGKFPKDFHG